MIINNQLIVIVVEDLLGKWLCVKTYIVKSNGFIFNVLNKKIYLKNGFVQNVKNKNKKQEIQFQGDILLITITEIIELIFNLINLIFLIYFILIYYKLNQTIYNKYKIQTFTKYFFKMFHNNTSSYSHTNFNTTNNNT